jgi:heat shock protein HslJ
MVKELMTTHIATSLMMAFLVAPIIYLALASPASAGGKPEIEEITEVVWKWQQTRYNNDQHSIPADPSHYTIIFNPDGTLNIRADCNRGGGTYTTQGKGIIIEVTHTTRAMCPPDSMDQEFIKNLNAAKIYFFKDGNLYFDLKYDTGTMVLSR